jgi:hypothetical protein
MKSSTAYGLSSSRRVPAPADRPVLPRAKRARHLGGKTGIVESMTKADRVRVLFSLFETNIPATLPVDQVALEIGPSATSR